MYIGLLHMHAFLRWIVLILLIVVIVKALSGWLGKKEFTKADDKLSLWAMIVLHIQLLIGLGLYFISPYVRFDLGMEVMKNAESRYWTVEHISMMIVGIAIVTVGRVLAKKKTEAVSKYKTTFIFYLIGLIVILSRIPFPFTNVSRDLFPTTGMFLFF